MIPVQKNMIGFFFFLMFVGMVSAQTIQLNIADTTATTGEIMQLPLYVETSLTGEADSLSFAD